MVDCAPTDVGLRSRAATRLPLSAGRAADTRTVITEVLREYSAALWSTMGRCLTSYLSMSHVMAPLTAMAYPGSGAR